MSKTTGVEWGGRGVEWGGRGVEWGGRGNQLRGQPAPRQPARAATSCASASQISRERSPRREPGFRRFGVPRSPEAGVHRFAALTRMRVPSCLSRCDLTRGLGRAGIHWATLRATPPHLRHCGCTPSPRLVAMVTAVLWTAFVSDRSIENAPFSLPLWALIVAFAATELVTVHIEARGEAHALTFSEIPTIVGLFLADPATVLLARLISGVVVLGFVRRQSLHKLLFNLALFGLEATVAAAILLTLVNPNDPVGVSSWPAVFLALVSATLLSTLTVTLAISVYSGWPGRQMVRQVLLVRWAVLPGEHRARNRARRAPSGTRATRAPRHRRGRRAVLPLPRVHGAHRASQEP